QFANITTDGLNKLNAGLQRSADSARSFGDQFVKAFSTTFADQIQAMIGALDAAGNIPAFLQRLGQAFVAAGQQAGQSAATINSQWPALTAQLKAQFPDLASAIQAAADKMGSLVGVWGDFKTRTDHINQVIGDGMKSLFSGIAGAS